MLSDDPAVLAQIAELVIDKVDKVEDVGYPRQSRLATDAVFEQRDVPKNRGGLDLVEGDVAGDL